MTELKFSGSILETEIRNERDPNRLNKIKEQVEMASKYQPHSQYWSDALKYVYDKN
jgi:hypothetical protein